MESMRTTDELVDSALAKSEHLLWQMSKLGIADDSEDQCDSTPTSVGTSRNTWGSFSCSESEDEFTPLETEHRCEVSLLTLEEDLCVRLRELEEELQIVRRLSECSTSCNCQATEQHAIACLAGLPTPACPLPLTLHNIRTQWAPSALSAPVCELRPSSGNGRLCKFAFLALEHRVQCESLEANI